MKAIVLKEFGGTGNFVFSENMAIPDLGPEEVLVKIKATAFNPIDYQMRQGLSERSRMHSPILGREFAGVVVRVGMEVDQFNFGDEVFAASGSMGSNGTYAEYIALPAIILAKKPANLSFQQAAAVPVVYLTALQIIDRLQMSTSATILVTGAAGGVGLAVVKLLLNRGHKNIVATAGNTRSREMLVQAGISAGQIIDYHNPNLVELVLGANQQQLFDVCIDLVGMGMSELCASVIRVNGSYADVTAFETAKARADFFDKGAVVYHISNYAHSLFNNLNWYGIQLNRIAEMLKDEQISPPPIQVFDSFSTQSVANAHQILEENKTNGNKIVMSIF